MEFVPDSFVLSNLGCRSLLNCFSHFVAFQQVFEELLERVREKEEKEAKKQKRLGDEFFNILCSLKVVHILYLIGDFKILILNMSSYNRFLYALQDITVDSKWEDCLPLFEDKEEFRAIGDEAFAWKIFEEYLDQLKEKEDREQKRKDEKVFHVLQ